MVLALVPRIVWGGRNLSPKPTRGPAGVYSADPAVAFNTALIDSLHRVAQPAALSDWNQRIAGTVGHFKRPHPRLTPDDLKRPTRIDHAGRGWKVIYGGVHPGPFIFVWINEKGLADSVWSRLVRN